MIRTRPSEQDLSKGEHPSCQSQEQDYHWADRKQQRYWSLTNTTGDESLRFSDPLFQAPLCPNKIDCISHCESLQSEEIILKLWPLNYWISIVRPIFEEDLHARRSHHFERWDAIPSFKTNNSRSHLQTPFILSLSTYYSVHIVIKPYHTLLLTSISYQSLIGTSSHLLR